MHIWLDWNNKSIPRPAFVTRWPFFIPTPYWVLMLVMTSFTCRQEIPRASSVSRHVQSDNMEHLAAVIKQEIQPGHCTLQSAEALYSQVLLTQKKFKHKNIWKTNTTDTTNSFEIGATEHHYNYWPSHVLVLYSPHYLLLFMSSINSPKAAKHKRWIITSAQSHQDCSKLHNMLYI